MELNKVAIIGAGAIGSYFIAGLSEKLGDNLWIVAEGERAKRLAANGIIINEKRYTLNVKTAQEAAGADLLIVAVKYGSLRECLPSIEQIVAAHTLVISPLNGVDSESVIEERIGMEHILYSFMKIASQRVGNEIKYNPAVTLGLFFGETNGERTPRIAALENLLIGTDVHFQISKNIEQDIWYKYALNISKNIPQAIINCGFGAYTDSTHLAYISDRLRDEVVKVAEKKGIDIKGTDNPAGNNTAIAPDSRFSTLQDLDAKRPTEIDMFSGTLIRMGKELGVETPFNEFAYHAVKCLEEKNEGVIW